MQVVCTGQAPAIKLASPTKLLLKSHVNHFWQLNWLYHCIKIQADFQSSQSNVVFKSLWCFKNATTEHEIRMENDIYDSFALAPRKLLFVNDASEKPSFNLKILYLFSKAFIFLAT